MKDLISLTILLIALCAVLGSLCVSIITNDGVWFIVGYPTGACMLIVERIWDKRGVI